MVMSWSAGYSLLRVLVDLRFCVCLGRRQACNLDEYILPAPEGNSRQPVLLFDQSLSARPIFGRKQARRGRELRTGDLTAHGARCDSHLRIIPDALVFPGIAPRLYIQLVIFFSKPNRRRHRDTALAEGGETDVFLALNFARHGHHDIVRDQDRPMSALLKMRAARGLRAGANPSLPAAEIYPMP